MTAMEQAFARVGIHGYGVRQVGRQLVLAAKPKPQPDPSIPPENHGISTTRQRLLEATAEIEAMSDRALEIEVISLTENSEAIKVELRGRVEQPELHELGWQRRAERALVGIKARQAVCGGEQKRRAEAAAVAAKAERAAEYEREMARQRELLEARRAAKAAKQALVEAEQAVRTQAFVTRAKALLPRETFVAIWDAVDAEAAE